MDVKKSLGHTPENSASNLKPGKNLSDIESAADTGLFPILLA
ncbi:hypothetical protein [Pseudomonas sp. B21-056]|jgi:hypothetical protein|nr:hypothetical protein [Pseudomonas sp. B21-056]